MPTYDVECSKCRYQGTIAVGISALTEWDNHSQCPECQAPAPSFRRVIKSVPRRTGVARPTVSKHSSSLDDMRHAAFKKRNPDQQAAARESVRKGEFEGF